MTMYGSKKDFKEADLRQYDLPNILSLGSNGRALQTTSFPYYDLRRACYTEVRNYISKGMFIGKSLRPWNIIPTNTVLPEDEVWVGFEVETGYPTLTGFKSAIKWVDKNTDRSCYDREGSGRFPVEFTFYPTTLDKMEWDSGPASLIRYGKKNPPSGHSPLRMIGTHANISTPKYRSSANSSIAYDSLSSKMSRAMIGINRKERGILFGREGQYRCEPVCFDTHMEYKWFNTTYDIRVWQGYCLVIKSVIKMMEEYEADATSVTSLRIIEAWRALIPEIKKLHKSRKSRYGYRTRNKEKAVCALPQ